MRPKTILVISALVLLAIVATLIRFNLELLSPPNGQLIKVQQDSNVYNYNISSSPKLGNDDDTSKALIFPEAPSKSMSWLSEFRQSFNIHSFPFASPQNGEMKDRIPVNKGFEAMAYLTYIIQNYDHLPAKSVFMHGHQTSWHQKEDVKAVLSDVIPESVNSYFNFAACRLDPTNNTWQANTELYSTPTNKLQLDALSQFWKEFNMTRYGFLDIQSTRITGFCCAQFVLPRNLILKNSLQFYVELRDWLIGTSMLDHYSSRVFEYLWQIIFADIYEDSLLTDDQCQSVMSHKK